MKILLVGEYSRLHNSLKKGLVELGHQVTIIGDGDSFKNYPVDISIKPIVINYNWFTRKFKVAFYKLTSIDLQWVETTIRFHLQRKKLKGYDIVQFINSNSLKTPISIQKKQLNYLKKYNGKFYLCACGTDTPVVDFLLKKKMENHILTPYLLKQYPEKKFDFELKYVKAKYKTYFSFFESQLSAINTSDIDYYIPFKNHPLHKGLIPNPIDFSELSFKIQPITDQICIFLGVNELSAHKKGSIFFEKALEIIQHKYKHKVKVIIARSLPYNEYINLYDTAHILLDMVYAYDQGYNALEAMAKGKVVFTGAEEEFLEYYNLQKDEVCINALPDVDYLVEKLSWLIENPAKIQEIGKNARKFIEEHHDYKKVAQQYLSMYTRN